MSLPIVLAATALAAPAGPPPSPVALLNEATVVTPGDYPSRALRRAEDGIASIAVTVSTEGKPTACKVTESSGSEELDRTTCQLYLRRARFTPPATETGNVFRTAVWWNVNSDKPSASPKLKLPVTVMPAGYAGPLMATCEFGGDGGMQQCRVTRSAGSAAIDRQIVEAIAAGFTIAPPVARDGAEPLGVRFVEASLEQSPS